MPFILLLLISFPAFAELTDNNPQVVCDWMRAKGYITRNYNSLGAPTYSCGSRYKEVMKGRAFPLANNIAYYARGDANEVSTVWLMLNVNHQPTADAAMREFLSDAQALSKAATGSPLPPTVSEAIAQGNYWSQSVGSARVKVEKEVWPTGKGYEIRVTFE
jgi:hypothetical protein